MHGKKFCGQINLHHPTKEISMFRVFLILSYLVRDKMHTFIDFEYFQVKQSFNNKQNASWTLFVFGNIFTVLLLETRQENWRWKQEKHFSFNSSLGRLVLIAVNLITTVLRGLGIRFFKEFFLQHNSILEYQRRKK